MTNTPLQQAQAVLASLKTVASDISQAQATLKKTASDLSLAQSQANALVTMLNTGTPPPANFPLGVIAAGLQTVYGNSTTAGLTGPTTLTPSANPGSLPPGTTFNGVEMMLVPPFTMTGWDFTGWATVVDNNGLGVFNNCRFSGPNAGQTLMLMGRSSSPTIVCNHCEFNGIGLSNFFDAIVTVYGGNFTDNGCYWHNSPVCFLDLGGSGNHMFENGYMALPGATGGGNISNHMQSIHFFGGTVNMNHYLVDWPIGTITCGVTAQLFGEPLNSNLNLTIENSIISNTGANPLNYPTETGNSTYTSALTITGCALEAATGAGSPFYWLIRSGVFSESGNFDYLTGAAIP